MSSEDWFCFLGGFCLVDGVFLVDERHKVCPIERAGKLDSWWRKFLQNPKRILSKHVSKNMLVLDIGCGPGFFTIPLAEMVGVKGKVVALDLQQEMLDIVKKKIENSNFLNIFLHKSGENSLNLSDNFDFILAFYVVHEVPDKQNFFKEVRAVLKHGSKMLIVEPKKHVTVQEFEDWLLIAKSFGFEEVERPRILKSRAVVIK